MNKPLLIIGAGGHGKVIAEIASDLGYEKIDFLDDDNAEAIGKIDEVEAFIEYGEAFCGIGNNKFRAKILSRLENAGYQIATLIHPSSYVSQTAVIGKGTVVEPKAVVNSNSTVGRGSIISVRSIIDHNVKLGICCHINSGAIVKAGGEVGDYKKLEAGEVRLGYLLERNK